MSRLYTAILLLFYLTSTGANDLFINGQATAISSATTSLFNNGALIYVGGDITNSQGLVVNASGTIELSGNWENTPTANNVYQSNGNERFSGSSDQTISGTMNGTIGNNNQFYNLYITKNAPSGEYVSLLNDVHVNAAGTLIFETSNGIIRTQATSIGTSIATVTGNYANYLYIQNPNTNAIVGNSTGSGAVTRYVEGKLKRQVNTNSTYFFPIGVNKSYLGGMNAFALTFNTVPASTGILSYLEIGSQNLIDEDVFTDVAQVDNNIGTPNTFSNCIGPPDGITDWAKLTEKISHQWNVTPDNLTAYNYNISVYPSTILENTATYYTIPCAPNTTIQYLARNGVPGGNLATYQPAAGFSNEIGYFMFPTSKVLPNQNSFSNFRLWGALDANTMLPISLISLEAIPIDNQYIQVKWSTGSELNNRGFEIQRSVDGTNYIPIGWVDGSGNSTSLIEYSFNDRNAATGILYYYRLKQIDFDNKFSLTNFVSAKLDPSIASVIGELYPNPTNGLAYINISSITDEKVKVTIYDILGQFIQDNAFNIKAGLNTLNINTTGLASGNYIAAIQIGNSNSVKKLIKK